MKIWLHVTLVVLVGIFGCSEVLAQESGGGQKGSGVPDTTKMEKEIRIQVEWIELSHEEFTAVMEEYGSSESNVLNSSNNGPLRAKLSQMIEEEKAEIIDTAVVMARSGQRAKVESIREFIYPTEYIPAGLNKKEKKKTESKSEEDDEANDKPAQLPIATAFETRNVGTTLEVDPVLGADERTSDLSLSPELVYHVGEEEYGSFKEKESEVNVKTPLFYTMKLTTQVTLIAGEYLFAGVQSPFGIESMKADRERKVMIFIKADVLYVGLPVKAEK